MAIHGWGFANAVLFGRTSMALKQAEWIMATTISHLRNESLSCCSLNSVAANRLTNIIKSGYHMLIMWTKQIINDYTLQSCLTHYLYYEPFKTAEENWNSFYFKWCKSGCHHFSFLQNCLILCNTDPLPRFSLTHCLANQHDAWW